MVQSKNGSGKTGAFVIGSLLRLDRKDPNIQVIVLCHTRELSNQIFEVYQEICKDIADIKIDNLTVSKKYTKGTQVCVTTLGGLKSITESRGAKTDLSSLKCFVIDEADVYFDDDDSNK